MPEKNASKNRILLLGLIGRAGTLHYASHLSSHMALRCDTYLLLPSYSDTSIIDKKVHLIREAAPPSMIKTILLTFNIFQHVRTVKALNRTGADTFNILDVHPWYILYWPFLKMKRRIVTINDPDLHSGETGPITTFVLRSLTRFLLKHADEIITLGDKQAETIEHMGYSQPIIRSRIGNYSFFKAKMAKRFPVEKNTLLFFGRIKDYKGLDYLLDALIILKKKGLKFRLIVSGEGDVERYKKQFAKFGKDELELNIGYVPDEKVSEYFQRAEFTVMPYTDATQTGVVQVSYSFHKPVIATRVGSLPELVVNGKTGLIVEPRNVQQLSKAIEELLSDQKKARAYGENAFMFMKRELDWKHIVKKLYSDIFKKRA